MATTDRTLVDVCRLADALEVPEDDELARVYFQSPRVSFAVADLPAGGASPVDPGHLDAHEVLFCADGSVVLELGHPAEDTIVLVAGDAALIREGVPHRVRNDAAAPARVVWAAAPGWGRPVSGPESL
jgi:mannose-6-phosphate isomerase-like protein (cupin superfamily)